MPKLPVVKPKYLLKKLKKVGFVEVRSTGSHRRLHHVDGRKVTVAYHNRPLKKGTFKSILRQAKLSVEDYLKIK